MFLLIDDLSSGLNTKGFAGHIVSVFGLRDIHWAK